jgi:hypothetical protein
MTVIALTMAATLSAQAQETTRLPDIRVPRTPPALAPGPADSGPAAGGGGGHSDGDAKNHCAETKPGEPPPLGCINQMMKRKVDETNPVTNTPPIDAKSSDLKTGVINIPGVQQQYGKNFGNSVVPYRPPPLIYNSPLGHK